MACSTFSRELESRLLQLGAWKGPGFACIIDDKKAVDESDLLDFAIHEYAHGLINPPGPVEAARSALGPTAFERILSTPREDTSPLCRPWDQHGADFVRLCVHLVYRTYTRTPFRPWRSLVFNGEAYCLPGYFSWSSALGDEPQRLVNLSMEDVAAMAPPASYSDFSTQALADAERAFFTHEENV